MPPRRSANNSAAGRNRSRRASGPGSKALSPAPHKLQALAAEMHRAAEQFRQLRADVGGRIARPARELEDAAKAEG